MKIKNLPLVIAGLLSLNLSGQETTLNRLDANGKKTGYWIEYLDEKIVPTDSANAYYKSFQFYDAGELPFDLFPKLKKEVNYEIKIENRAQIKGSPFVLQGFAEWYSRNPKSKDFYVYTKVDFNDGYPVRIEETFFAYNDTNSFFIYDFTKRYQGTEGTFFIESHRRHYSSKKIPKGFALGDYGRYKTTKQEWFRKVGNKWKNVKVEA